MRPRKFEEAAKDLEGKIVSGSLKPGEPLPSQSKLCEIYSLSRSCAQKALDSLVMKGLLETRPGKGVYVKGAKAGEASARRFKNVALIFHQEFRLVSDPADNFGLEMLWGVEEELRKLGANCIVRKRERSESFERIVPELEAIGADAFIMDREFSDEQLRPLRALGVPIAVLGRLSFLPFVSSSLPNHGDCFMKAFVRMADEGRSSAALLYSRSHYYGAELKLACERARELRPSFDIELYDLDCPLGAGVLGGVDGALRRIREGGMPEVLVFSNDWHALRALELLAKEGLSVPGEVSVLGCFGIELGAKSEPSLSSLSVDARELGRRAVRTLAASALEGAEPGVERVPFVLLERDSFKWKSQEL